MVNRNERRAVACILLTVIAVVAAASYDRERLEIAKQILEEVPLTDGYVLTFSTNLNIPYKLQINMLVISVEYNCKCFFGCLLNDYKHFVDVGFNFFRHNDLPWNIRKFLRNQINDFELDTDLTQVEPWSKSKYSHTDLPRLRQGMVGAQVILNIFFKLP